MATQRTGSAKKNLLYHNTLILHKNKNLTVKDQIKETALCGLGQTGPNPILSSLRYFRDEFNAHIVDKKCPAKRCVALLDFVVDPEICTKCGLCFRACPADAIIWQKKEIASIDKEKCIKCLTCFAKCQFGAIS